MDRIVVVGNSGSGKTSFARNLAEALEVAHLEMDSVFHRGGWSATPDDVFRQELAEFAAQPRWVADGNYTSHGSREVLWPLADTVIWLDLPRRTIMRRVVGRTFRRVITREELWEGVKEPWENLYSLVPERNIIVWAWTRYRHVREKYQTCMEDGSWAHADVYRLTTQREADRFLDAVCESGPYHG